MMSDGTILLTGGNSGLGLECAKVLVRAPGDRHIVIASRDEGASAGVIDSLRGSAATHIEARRLDLGELADARRFADALCADLGAARLPPLRVAIFNAGLQFNARERSKDGFEATFAVNHLGHFLLTQLLIDAFEAPARIIFVSSGTHDPDQRTGMPEPIPRPAAELADADADTGDDEGTFGRRAYTTSKLCNVLCAYELSRRLEKERPQPTRGAHHGQRLRSGPDARNRAGAQLCPLAEADLEFPLPRAAGAAQREQRGRLR
jgi:NAD(P)-dependent dehydrogenase (short-subunit alcohol dehydrogenase family)